MVRGKWRCSSIFKSIVWQRYIYCKYKQLEVFKLSPQFPRLRYPFFWILLTWRRSWLRNRWFQFRWWWRSQWRDPWCLRRDWSGSQAWSSCPSRSRQRRPCQSRFEPLVVLSLQARVLRWNRFYHKRYEQNMRNGRDWYLPNITPASFAQGSSL